MKLKDYLIASPENNYEPWITSATAMAMFSVLFFGLRLLILPSAFTTAAPGIDAVDLMTKVNQERTNRYIPALKINDKLTIAATAKSNDMLSRSYFGHVDPDGKYVWPRVEAAGYKPYLTLGENLAMDFTTSGGVVAGWMNSPGHRANLLNEKFEDQGMAAIYGLYEPNHHSTIVTNLFGTLSKKAPAAAATAPTPTSSKPAPKPAVKPASPPAATSTDQSALPSDSTGEIKTTPPATQAPQATNSLPITVADTQRTMPAPSGETQLYFALRLIFTIFAGCYVFFLILDSVLIYRAKIKRGNASSSPRALLFILFVLVNVFAFYL